MKQVLITISTFIKNERFNFKQFKFSAPGIFTVLISFTLLIAGCQKQGFDSSSQNQVISNASINKNVKKQVLPFKGGFATIESVIEIKGNTEHDRITGIGQLTHLGNATFVADIQFDVVDFSAPITGVQTTVAANGDKIFSTFSGYSNVPDAEGNIQANLSETITGGTGRFINATGTFTVKANGNINVPEGKNIFDGTISY
jgi:hypothetical protein